MLTSAILGMLLALLTTLPLAWKWQLGVTRVLLFVVAVSTVAGALTQSFSASASLSPVMRAILVWGVTVACAAMTLAYRFYRDPERKPPGGQDVIVSPAEGEVIYVREARGGMLPVATKRGREIELEELTRTPLRHGDAVVVGIAMSFMDVHVNRAPIGGRIALQRHFPGSFGSLRSSEMVFANERMTTVIERDELQVAVVQIASRLVRQIVSFVHEGEAVVLGQTRPPRPEPRRVEGELASTTAGTLAASCTRGGSARGDELGSPRPVRRVVGAGLACPHRLDASRLTDTATRHPAMTRLSRSVS
jgi:phosphatidylserine decarboxylase